MLRRLVSDLRAITYQGRDEAQERLMLWVMRSTAEKGSDLELRHPTARGRVRFMPDEDSLGLGVGA